MTATFFEGNARVVLREFPANFFHCAVTSPPYFGLRSYDGGVEMWDGEADCDHEWGADMLRIDRGAAKGKTARVGNQLREISGVSTVQDNLCSKCGAWRGQLGAEPTPELFVQHLIQIMREVRRVLRPDGVFWLNIGDSWASGKGTCFNPGGGSSSLAGHAHLKSETAYPLDRHNKSDLVARGVKPLDVELIPEQLALAARADGRYLRSVLIWAKGVSLSEEYNGNPMPESVNGWRWERHRVKVAKSARANASSYHSQAYGDSPIGARDGRDFADHGREWQDCPGCLKCEPNGGYILRKGSWRPTDSYEHVLMLAKTNSYFCDREAVIERGVYPAGEHRSGSDGHKSFNAGSRTTEGLRSKDWVGNGGRNLRSVLAIPTTGSKIKHFATFPPRLVTPLIKAATSEKGCCYVCGSPWARVIERGRADHDGSTATSYSVGENANRIALLRQAARERGGEYVNRAETVGWLPTCSCSTQRGPVPCWVLDPFCGSGTVSLVCERLGLDSVGIDTSAKYIRFSEKRIAEDARKRGAGG